MNNRYLQYTALVILFSGLSLAQAQVVEIEIEIETTQIGHIRYLPEGPGGPMTFIMPDGVETRLLWLEISSHENIEIAVSIGGDVHIPHVYYINKGSFNTREAILFKSRSEVFPLHAAALKEKAPGSYSAWIGVPEEYADKITIEYP